MMYRVIVIVTMLTIITATAVGEYPFNRPKKNRISRQDFIFPDSFGSSQNNPAPPNQNAYQQSQNNYNPPRPLNRPTTFAPVRPVNNQNSFQANRVDERISVTKCNEYKKLSEKKIMFSQLSLWSTVIDLSENQCDTSTGLIVGGKKASVGEFPHMAAIGYRGLESSINFGCGGSLISERFVLTAAHCRMNGRTPASVVRLGTINLDTAGDDQLIERFISHEFYNSDSKQNDIAVVKLQNTLYFGEPSKIRPACLWTKREIGETKTIASGWGYTTYGGQISRDLMKVQLDLLDTSICQSAFDDRDDIIINNNQICSGVLAGDKDTCQGDSGGPIQVSTSDDKCISYIIGITSYGGYCGGKNSPSVYTRVSAYVDWIESNVWE